MDLRTLDIDPRSKQRLTDRFGHVVEGWFAQLPAVLVTLADRWRLDLGEQIPRGSASVGYRCRLADGRPAVLKASPDHARIIAEAAALRAWHTVHVPRVIASDETLGALLIEGIDPGVPLDAQPDQASGETVAELMHAVHLDSPGPSFPSLATRVDELFRSTDALYRQDPGLTVVISNERAGRGRSLADHLARREHRDVLLHGDLTPANILVGGEARGLVAIDPVPCVGDAAFDTVGLVLWRADSVATVERRAERLAAVMNVDASIIFSWCVALAGAQALAMTSMEDSSSDHIDTLVELSARA